MTGPIKSNSYFKPSLQPGLLLLLLAFLNTACKPLVFHEQSTISDYVTIRSDASVGQTFVSRFDGLEGMALFVKIDPQGQDKLRLTLHPGTEKKSEIIRESVVSLNEMNPSGYIRFQFNPIIHSTNQYYYAQLTYIGNNSVQIGSGLGGSYLNGAFYSNGEPIDAQSAFRLIHDPLSAGLGILREFLLWSGVLVISIFLFILPGWALLLHFLPAWSSLHWGDKLGLSIGTSLPLYPLLILWTGLLGIHLGRLYAWIPPVGGLLLLIWNYLRSKNRKKSNQYPIHTIRDEPRRMDSILVEVALVIVIGLLVFSRLWIIRNVEIPLFGDSYQHTLITQLLVDHNGLFNSWQPYADLTTFTYHFGFHSFAAAYQWITGTPSPQAVLWTGQILNILSILALIPLATRIGHSVWSGVVAVLVAGLLTLYPMFYVNWGRYTQLAGQAILPALVYLIWTGAENKGFNWKIAVLTSVIWGGLALTHYRVVFFAVLFLVASLLFFIRSPNRLRLFYNTVYPGILGAILFLPWLFHLYSGNMLVLFNRLMSNLPSQDPAAISPTTVAGMAFSYLPLGIWMAMFLGIGWGLYRRERGINLICLWWVFMLLITNPNWLNLPGAGIISNLTTLIAAYIPAGIILGSMAGWLVNNLRRGSNLIPSPRQKATLNDYLPILCLILTTSLAIWGTRIRLADLHMKDYALVTQPDLRAAAWIQSNTPIRSRFLVNSFLAFGDFVSVGSDAGWWLPVIAKRATTLPPINQSFEQGPFEDYRDWVNLLTKAIQTQGFTDSNLMDLLKEREISYVFIGQQQGRVNNPGVVLDPYLLSSLPQFVLVYHQDRVWIFKFRNIPDNDS